MITIQPTDLDREKLASLALEPSDIADDFTDYHGVVVQKPWGKEWQVYKNSDFSVWRLDLKANAETSMHAHPGKTTILTVAEGAINFTTLDKHFNLTRGDVMVIERGVFHKSATVTGAVLMEIESPPVKTDLVRLNDKYGREGQGYEKCGT